MVETKVGWGKDENGLYMGKILSNLWVLPTFLIQVTNFSLKNGLKFRPIINFSTLTSVVNFKCS